MTAGAIFRLPDRAPHSVMRHSAPQPPTHLDVWFIQHVHPPLTASCNREAGTAPCIAAGSQHSASKATDCREKQAA
jgi:hypothetical protein